MPAGDAYRALADDFQRRAAEENDPNRRKEFERLAREYRRQADSLEQRTGE